MIKTRIREVALRMDGSDVWYYPEISVITKKKKGLLFWKKAIEIETWEVFFETSMGVEHKSKKEIDNMWITEQQHVVGFRNLEEAKTWVNNWTKKEDARFKKSREQWYKFIGARAELETTKIH